MAWEEEAVEILRVLANDLAETPTYSDERLQRVILVAAKQVSDELTFSQTFVVDIMGCTITPDPTATATRDDSYMNLVCIKAACIIDRGSAAQAAGQAIAVKDGSSAIDLRDTVAGRLKLLDKSWCKVYQDTKEEFLYNTSGVAGAAVIGPFRKFARGNFGGSNYYNYDPRTER